MKYLAIIIARMGSSRLPGKVMMDLHGMTVLERIVSRVKAQKRVDYIGIATTNQSQDKPIRDFCKENSIFYYAGSEKDVLDRVIKTSQAAPWEHDYVIDLTADCPLVCPLMLYNLIDAVEKSHVEYASNIAVRSFPDGFDLQIVKKEILYDVYRLTPEYHRCHSAWNVLAYANMLSVYNLVPHVQEYWRPEVGLTLDTQEDYETIKRVYKYFLDIGNPYFNYLDVMELITRKPEILVNQEVVRKIPGRDES